MNKYKQKLISFAAAAAMLVSALPVQVGAVNRTDDAENYYYAIDGTEDWTKSSNAVEVISAGTTVTLTGNTESDDSATGNAYFKLPGNPPTSGNVTFSFTYTCSAGENGTRSSFSLVNMLPNNIDIDTAKDYGFGVANYTDSMRVPFNGDNNAYNDGNYNTATTYKINASVDYSSQTISYTIFDKDGNSLMGVSEYKDGYLSMENEKIDNIENFKFQYLIFYVRNGATITVSDFVIYAEGATPPTGEPTEEPVETETPVVTDTPGENDSDFIYNLDTDKRENQGWTPAPASGTAGGGSVSYNNDQLTLTNTAQGDRSQTVTFERTDNMADQVKIDLTLTMTADKDGDVGTASGAYTHFKLTDENENDILALMLGNDGIGGKESTLYLNGDDTGITANENGSVTVKVIAIADYDNDTLYVTLMQDNKAVYSANLPMAAGTPAKAVSVLHRGDAENVIPKPQTVVDELKLQNVTSPMIFVAGTGGSIGSDGTVNFTIEVGETVSMALLRNYATNSVRIVLQDGTTENLSDDTTHIDNEFATAEYVPTYNGITVRGKSKGTLGPFTVSITGTGEEPTTVTRTFKIEVIDAEPEAMPTTQPLTELGTPQPILAIDFESDSDENKEYTISDEYGETLDDSYKLTTVEDTNDGLIYDYSTASPSGPQAVKTSKPDYSGIEGNAFYSFLNTDKVKQYDSTDTQHAKNLAGNGYRGSKLSLDNELIQRTDKIHVSYDFALYNIINTDYDNTSVGMPVSITMTSEAIGTGSIPYDFNAEHCFEIDADPSNTEEISKHLLTFFTGRPKRDTTNGVHWVDMTNRLAYFDPLYKTESNPYGQYRDLTELDTLSAGYNFFHVEAKVDFYNNMIEFTITQKTGTDNDKSQTITTTIPEHSSWNGFIIASNKWDRGDAADTDGVDTEHYAYLDNIKAERISVDDKLLDTTVPTARPVPTDAVSFVDSTGKNFSTSDTWAHYGVYTELQMPAPETGYVSYCEETESKDFTHRIANEGDSDEGITSYTEFDFYLPKKGSYITLSLVGTKDGHPNPGNTITISTAGINSWTNMEDYTKIYDELECGKWYSMQLEYDFLDSVMRVNVYDGETEIASSVVGTRTLNNNYYRQLCFNPASIVTVGASETTPSGSTGLPAREPSMALTYIANLRIYNRATVKEYYPEGTTANETTGDAMNGSTKANQTRIGSIATDFIAWQVNDSDPSTNSTAVLVGTLDPPKSSDGKTFSGWKLIYSNGSNSNIESNNEGTNATRLKYVPEYSDLPVDSAVSDTGGGYYYKTFWTDIPIISGNNFKTVEWYVYAKSNENSNYEFRMSGDFDMTEHTTVLTGEGKYRVGYVVYNIPDSMIDVIALPQAHHEPVNTEATLATPLPNGATPGPYASSMPEPSDAPEPDGTRPTPDPSATLVPVSASEQTTD